MHVNKFSRKRCRYTHFKAWTCLKFKNLQSMAEISRFQKYVFFEKLTASSLFRFHHNFKISKNVVFSNTSIYFLIPFQGYKVEFIFWDWPKILRRCNVNFLTKKLLICVSTFRQRYLRILQYMRSKGKNFLSEKKFRRRESGMASTAACLRLDKQDGKLIP